MEAPQRGAQEPRGEATLETLWEGVLERVARRIRREQFETWFRRTAPLWLTEEKLCIAVHNGFTRDWLNTYYHDVLQQAVSDVLGGGCRVIFEVAPESTPAPAPPPRAEEDDPPARTAAAGPPSGSRRLLAWESDFRLNDKYQFDTFVVGPCNRFAHAACVGVSENPGRTYNPLFLHGSVGLGKTHLLQSLCHALLDRWTDPHILFLSCETFVNHFISAIENGDLQKFRTKYRNVDVLVVDDIHVLANKERTQEEFFHTFNTLYNDGKQIVLSSDCPPLEIPTLQDRLVSRFKWGLVTEIEAPCYETRMAILKRKSRERGLEIQDDVARILAERIQSNIRELEGAVNTVLGYASLTRQRLEPALLRQCLPELFVTRRGQLSIEDITTVVTEHFGVKLPELQSKRRTNAIAYPRQVAMYLARRVTRMSLEEIGGYFGGRDHSTVLYGVQKIEQLCRTDPAAHTLVQELLGSLQDGQPG